MAEELAFEQVLGDRAAVDGYERFVLPRPRLMDRLGHEALARSALSRDEDVALARDDLFHHDEHFLHGVGTADDVRESRRPLAQFWRRIRFSIWSRLLSSILLMVSLISSLMKGLVM